MNGKHKYIIYYTDWTTMLLKTIFMQIKDNLTNCATRESTYTYQRLIKIEKHNKFIIEK